MITGDRPADSGYPDEGQGRFDLDYVPPGTLLDLAAVARMMLADGRVMPEEADIFEGLLAEHELDLDTRFEVEGWAWCAPDSRQLGRLASWVDEAGREEALAVAWVVALADGDVDPEEERTLAEMAEELGLPGRADAVRRAVEDKLYPGALTVVGAVAAMVCAGGDAGPARRACFAKVLGGLGLPEALAPWARALLCRPQPAEALVAEAARLPAGIRQALLGHLRETARADGEVDPAALDLLGRFEEACAEAAPGA